MDNTKELKPIYDIFTAAWRAYREHYPPENPQDDTYWSKLVDDLHEIHCCLAGIQRTLPAGNPQDDTYWSKLVDDLHEIESQYNCQLCRDILCNVASDLERKAKVLHQSK